MTFSIGSADYSGHIVVGTYNINKVEECETYKDGNGRTHKMHILDKVKGSFDMFFRTLEDFTDFIADLEVAKNHVNNTYSLTLSVNNINQEQTKDCFITFVTNRTLDGKKVDFFEQFTITIEEA